MEVFSFCSTNKTTTLSVLSKVGGWGNYCHQNKDIFGILQTVTHKCGVVQHRNSTHLSNWGIPGDWKAGWLSLLCCEETAFYHSCHAAMPGKAENLAVLQLHAMAVTNIVKNRSGSPPALWSERSKHGFIFVTPLPGRVCNDHCHPQ